MAGCTLLKVVKFAQVGISPHRLRVVGQNSLKEKLRVFRRLEVGHQQCPGGGVCVCVFHGGRFVQNERQMLPSLACFLAFKALFCCVILRWGASVLGREGEASPQAHAPPHWPF